MVAKWPLRWTATTASNSSSLVLANIRSRTMPALLTRTSSPPKVSTAVWTRPGASSQSATFAPLVTASPPAAAISSTTPRAALPPPAGDPSTSTPLSLTTTRAHSDIVDHHPRALTGERKGVRTPDAAARTRHDDHAAVEQTHPYLLT